MPLNLLSKLFQTLVSDPHITANVVFFEFHNSNLIDLIRNSYGLQPLRMFGINVSVFFLFSLSNIPSNSSACAPVGGLCSSYHLGTPSMNSTISLSDLPAQIMPGSIYDLIVKPARNARIPVNGRFQFVALDSKISNIDSFRQAGSNVNVESGGGQIFSEYRPFKTAGVSCDPTYQGLFVPEWGNVSVPFKEDLTEELIVSPNPARDVIRVQSPLAETDYALELLSLDGRVMKMMRTYGGIEQLDLIHLPPGVYILCEQRPSVQAVKIVKL